MSWIGNVVILKTFVQIIFSQYLSEINFENVRHLERFYPEEGNKYSFGNKYYKDRHIKDYDTSIDVDYGTKKLKCKCYCKSDCKKSPNRLPNQQQTCCPPECQRCYSGWVGDDGRFGYPEGRYSEGGRYPGGQYPGEGRYPGGEYPEGRYPGDRYFGQNRYPGYEQYPGESNYIGPYGYPRNDFTTKGVPNLFNNKPFILTVPRKDFTKYFPWLATKSDKSDTNIITTNKPDELTKTNATKTETTVTINTETTKKEDEKDKTTTKQNETVTTPTTITESTVDETYHKEKISKSTAPYNVEESEKAVVNLKHFIPHEKCTRDSCIHNHSKDKKMGQYYVNDLLPRPTIPSYLQIKKSNKPSYRRKYIDPAYNIVTIPDKLAVKLMSELRNHKNQMLLNVS